MANVAIATDSNSGILPAEGEALGVAVVPMPVHIDGKVYHEGIDLTHGQFYEMLLNDAEVSTSQPTPDEVISVWEKCLRDHREVVYIPMSAGLSGSYQTAAMLAQGYDGRVFVVDNRRISVTQRLSVMDALALADEGHTGEEIKRILEEQALDACIYLAADTLKYLRRGGRVTGAEAVVGSALGIRPVMEIYGEKLTCVSKVRGMKSARDTIIQRVKADINGRLKHLWDAGKLRIGVAYSQVPENVLADWKAEVLSAIPGAVDIVAEPLSLSIACHTGPGALGAGAVRIYH